MSVSDSRRGLGARRSHSWLYNTCLTLGYHSSITVMGREIMLTTIFDVSDFTVK